MQQLVFVGGFPSGGTDLVKTILNAHPDIYLNGEMPFLYQLESLGFSANTSMTNEKIEELRSFLKAGDIWGNIEQIDTTLAPEMDLPKALERLFSDRQRLVWGNKTPQNTEHIIELSRIFPAAKFIIVVRDIRDICLSYRNKWGKDMNWCAAKWAQRMHRGWQYSQNLPAEQSMFVMFESLLNDTEATCDRLCEFLNIPFSARMLEHHKHTELKIDGKRNYGQPVISKNQQKWRTQLSAEQVERIEEIALETMNLFGYQPAYATHSRVISSMEHFRGQINDLSALLLVGNRASADNRLITRLQNVADKIAKERHRLVNNQSY